MTVRKFAAADYTIFAYTVVWILVSLWPMAVDQTYAGEFETILMERSDWSVYFMKFGKGCATSWKQRRLLGFLWYGWLSHNGSCQLFVRCINSSNIWEKAAILGPLQSEVLFKWRYYAM